MTRTARPTPTRIPRPFIRPVVLTMIGMSALLAAPLAGAAAQASERTSGHAAAQQAYVASLVVSHDAAAGYTLQDDYVRGLVYWHHHPDWGISLGGVV